MSAQSAAAATTEATKTIMTEPESPVIVIHDSHETDDDDLRDTKRAKTTSTGSNDNDDDDDDDDDDDSASSKRTRNRVGRRRNRRRKPRTLRPGSDALLENMLYPLPKEDFLRDHFRRDAVCVRGTPGGSRRSEEMVSRICGEYLFGLDVRRMFEETSGQGVFLWLSSKSSSSSSSSTTKTTLDSVEISDPDVAHALHVAGKHPAYCRAPPGLERRLVGSLLRATGMGGGHYHPPHDDEAVTLGGGTTLGRGEVELFVGGGGGDVAPPRPSPAPRRNGGADGKREEHTTGWHYDFQENFTIQLSGVKRWTLRRGRVRHPLRATTPHYARDPGVVEDQLKAAHLSRPAASSATAFDGAHGHEYGEDNAYGPTTTVTLSRGDVLYFPAGMWHRVETVEPGVSMNVSLMGTTYATLACEALRHLMVGADEGWREVVASRPGVGAEERLRGLLGGLGRLVDDFVKGGGGARSVLPPALCHPPLGGEGSSSEDESGGEIDGDGESDEGENQSSGDERSGPTNAQNEGDGDGDGDGDGEEEDDIPTSGIVVPMDEFEGPPGWTCARPANARLVRNPLASLLAMSEIAHGRHPDGGARDEAKRGNTKERYVLNVNFAGNEAMESHVRVVLETSDAGTAGGMDRWMGREARGDGPGDGGAPAPPPCLFYYGYFSWGDAARPSPSPPAPAAGGGRAAGGSRRIDVRRTGVVRTARVANR